MIGERKDISCADPPRGVYTVARRPPVIEIREVTPEDLDAVTRRLAAEFPEAGMTRANIAHQIWGDEHYEPHFNLAAWDGPRLRGVLLGVARSGRAWIKALTIGPDSAVPEQLLGRFESALAEHVIDVIDVSGAAPHYFLPGIDVRDAPAVMFYQSHGFQKVGEAFNMSCDLVSQSFDTAAAEAAAADAGYRVARLTPPDATALSNFVNRSFSTGWTAETLKALDNQPVTCHVAWQGPRIVAFAAAEVTGAGLFGPMGSSARHRRRGLGEILLRRCLADLRDLGYRRCEISWVGPLAFYARHCGAGVSRVFWQYRKQLG
jgi:ribosomal protein S18 acetylase RimI-like enzyme